MAQFRGIPNSGGYIPEYSVLFFDGISSEALVVVPVINEGDRLHRLLDRMVEERIFELADVVIIDGGSTDGSLDPRLLRQLGVRGLLRYRGSAGLSAQLQVAYAFALLKDYSSIVTIDGNNKDDPEAIPRFLKKLEEGFDFIQGSRFLPDGFHKNTPLLRLFAVRFIHAPILSLSSGYSWTDTTQGFRAYSARMLRDPRIAIFRPIFSGYSLLMYLSYKAPKAGYNVVEIGSRREYPQGKVPTKISAVRGSSRLFKDLLKASLGLYNP